MDMKSFLTGGTQKMLTATVQELSAFTKDCTEYKKEFIQSVVHVVRLMISLSTQNQTFKILPFYKQLLQRIQNTQVLFNTTAVDAI